MSTFDATVSMLKTLPESDLIAVQGVIKALSARRDEESLYRPMTEAELMGALATGRENVRQGKVLAAHDSVRELRAKYGL